MPISLVMFRHRQEDYVERDRVNRIGFCSYLHVQLLESIAHRSDLHLVTHPFQLYKQSPSRIMHLCLSSISMLLPMQTRAGGECRRQSNCVLTSNGKHVIVMATKLRRPGVDV